MAVCQGRLQPGAVLDQVSRPWIYVINFYDRLASEKIIVWKERIKVALELLQNAKVLPLVGDFRPKMGGGPMFRKVF